MCDTVEAERAMYTNLTVSRLATITGFRENTTNDYFGVGFERIACREIQSRLMEWVDKWEKVAKEKEVIQHKRLERNELKMVKTPQICAAEPRREIRFG